MAWFIYSIVAHSKNTYPFEFVHTVGALNAPSMITAEKKALLIAKKRWPELVGWTGHSVNITEVSLNNETTNHSP